MRRVRTYDLESGMVVAKPVYSSQGKLLLNEGVTITPAYPRQLERLGIPAVYIVDERMQGAVISDVVADQTRLEATIAVREVVDAVKIKTVKEVGRNFDFNDLSVRSSVNHLIDDLLASRNVVVSLTDIRANDDFTFGHSVNVTILSSLMGMTFGYNDSRLRELGVGALMHDIGKVGVPDEIVSKRGPLTASELVEMEKHTTYGFDILRAKPSISILSAHVAFQHHERLGGQGYPRQLLDSDITEYSRIVAVASVYDNLTSDRLWRRGLTPVEALTVMRGYERGYDNQCLRALTDCIALYPIGTLVELNTRERALVIRTRKGLSDRPVVRVIIDAGGIELKHSYDVDLFAENRVFITRAVTRGPLPDAGQLEEIRQML